MSDTKFTPGPWEIMEHSWSHIGVYAGDKGITALDIYNEATEENEADLGAEMLANSSLIAAAPDLYEFAAEFVEAWADGMAGDSSLLDKAKAAIAKATGEING